MKGLLFLSAAVLGALPPEQTTIQAKVLAKKKEQSKSDSDAAVKHLLAEMDGSTFRNAIKGVAQLHNKSSNEMLEMLRTEVHFAHYMHTLPYSYPKLQAAIDAAEALEKQGISEHQLKASVEEVMKLGYLPTVWEQLAIGEAAWQPKWKNLNTREVWMGYPNFTGSMTKPSIQESYDRPIYLGVNLWKRAAGNIEYGNVTLFCDMWTRGRDIFMAPVDTGHYYDECIWPNPPPGPFQNCSAWNGKSWGSFDDYFHMILPHVRYWGLRLSDLFLRWYDNAVTPPPRSFLYLEADLSASFPIPETLKYIVVRFDELWGHSSGRKMQTWARSIKRPLGWASDYDSDIVLDPVVNQTSGKYIMTKSDSSLADSMWGTTTTWDHFQSKMPLDLHLHLMGYFTSSECTSMTCPQCRYLGVNKKYKCIYWKP